MRDKMGKNIFPVKNIIVCKTTRRDTNNYLKVSYPKVIIFINEHIFTTPVYKLAFFHHVTCLLTYRKLQTFCFSLSNILQE